MGMQGCEGEDGRVMSAHEAGRGMHDGHAKLVHGGGM